MDSSPVEGGDIHMFDVVLRQMGPLLTSLHSNGSARLQGAGLMVGTGRVSGQTTTDTGAAAAKQQQEDYQLLLC